MHPKMSCVTYLCSERTWNELVWKLPALKGEVKVLLGRSIFVLWSGSDAKICSEDLSLVKEIHK